jgi:transcriptional regulator with XRE-family HTH domain
VAKSKGFSQTDLAEKLGIKPAAVSAWGKEGLNPSAKRLPEIAEILGVTVNYLITGDDSPQASQSLENRVTELERLVASQQDSIRDLTATNRDQQLMIRELMADAKKTTKPVGMDIAGVRGGKVVAK